MPVDAVDVRVEVGTMKFKKANDSDDEDVSSDGEVAGGSKNDDSSTDSDNVDEETLQKRPAKKSHRPLKNPFFGEGAKKSKSSKVKFEDEDETDSWSDDSDGESDFSDTDSGEDEEVSSSIKDGTADDDDDEGEDSLIKALKAAKQPRDRTCPPDIRHAKRDLTDLAFHPQQNMIATALIDGEINLFEYSNNSNKLRKKLKIHKQTVRSIEFAKDGKHLVSGCTNAALKVTDVETSKVSFKAIKSHDSALYKVKWMTDNLLASGDEDGTVKIWDKRKNPDSGGKYGIVMESKQFDEHVNDIFFDSLLDERTMVASSGEGTIQSFNIRGKRPDMQSEVYEGEFSGMASVLKNSKLVVGCGDGKTYMFNWGQFGYHSAEFPGHPDGINSLIAVTDNVVITGCEDGVIRAVHLYPHRFVGTVGHHEDHFPIEKLDVSAEGDTVASISHDQRVKFWNIKYLEQMDYKKTQKPFKQPSKNMKMKRKANKQGLSQEKEHQLPSSKRSNRKDFFTALSES